MISLSDWLKFVEQNVNRVRQYQLGMDGTNGLCDCIGLIIGAVRLSGNKWTGNHGSNYACRNRMKTLHLSSSGLKEGELVYKAYEPGEAGYDLPATYSGDSDKRDYYHVGVVASINPLRIVHCTSVQGGIKRDTTIGKWKYAGELDIVDYTEGKGDVVTMTGTVTAKNGSIVNIRSDMSTNSAVVGRAKVGDDINIITYGDDWCYVEYNGTKGYMKTEFICVGEKQPDSDDVTITISRDAAMLLYESLRTIFA